MLTHVNKRSPWYLIWKVIITPEWTLSGYLSIRTWYAHLFSWTYFMLRLICGKWNAVKNAVLRNALKLRHWAKRMDRLPMKTERSSVQNVKWCCYAWMCLTGVPVNIYLNSCTCIYIYIYICNETWQNMPYTALDSVYGELCVGWNGGRFMPCFVGVYSTTLLPCISDLFLTYTWHNELITDAQQTCLHTLIPCLTVLNLFMYCCWRHTVSKMSDNTWQIKVTII